MGVPYENQPSLNEFETVPKSNFNYGGGDGRGCCNGGGDNDGGGKC